MPLRLPRAAALITTTITTTTTTTFAAPSRIAFAFHPGSPWFRGFHAATAPLRMRHLESKDHYARLNLEPSASLRDIKKSFYSLSKVHHPDANPSNPDAASTFSLLSESYTILSDPSRRAAYDRDVLHLHHPAHQQQHHHHHAASYHSTNPAGGRAPSGLSRRRGTFRGPPPSFYRSGGWGPQADKRRKAHEESTGSANPTGADDPWASASEARGGMGPGSDPYHFQHHFYQQQQQHQQHQQHHNEDVPPHFDKAGHTRTHQREDLRRWRRARTAFGDDGVEFEPQTSLVGHFFIVAGILAATFLAPVVYLQFMRLGTKKKDED